MTVAYVLLQVPIKWSRWSCCFNKWIDAMYMCTASNVEHTICSVV